MRRKNTARRGIIIRSITRRTAMSLYLSGPNDSRNNRGSRYQETFFLVLSVFFFPSSSTRKSEASSRPTRVTTYFFIGARTAAVIAGIAYSVATYMHSQFFPLAIGHGRGGWKNPGAWRDWTIRTGNERARLGYTQRERHLSQRSPRGKFYSTRDVARYRGYYFPRIFFVISANCTRRAGGRSQDLRRRSPVSRNARLSTRLSFRLNKRVLILSSDVFCITAWKIMPCDSARRKSALTVAARFSFATLHVYRYIHFPFKFQVT